jgi:hypothetical protein
MCARCVHYRRTGVNGANREELQPLLALFPDVENPKVLVAAEGRAKFFGPPGLENKTDQAEAIDAAVIGRGIPVVELQARPVPPLGLEPGTY